MGNRSKCTFCVHGTPALGLMGRHMGTSEVKMSDRTLCTPQSACIDRPP